MLWLMIEQQIAPGRYLQARVLAAEIRPSGAWSLGNQKVGDEKRIIDTRNQQTGLVQQCHDGKNKLLCVAGRDYFQQASN